MARGYCPQCRQDQRVPGYRGSRLEHQACKHCGGHLVGASSRLGREIEFDSYAANAVQSIREQAAPGRDHYVDESAIEIWGRCLAERAFQLWPALRGEPRRRRAWEKAGAF